MTTSNIYLAKTDSEIHEIANLASVIWKEHFTSIIGEAQVRYMLEHYQSYPAIKEQIEQEGYEYYQIYCSHCLAGYMALHPEKILMTLSRFYIGQDFRGQHLASAAFAFLKELCGKRGLSEIQVACNRNNTSALAFYYHLGFVMIGEQIEDLGHGFLREDYLLSYKM